MEVGVHEAKTHFSKLLQRVALGEEVIIRRGSEVVARLVPPAGRRERRFGTDEGKFTVPADFDAPLPDEVLKSFEA